jgi:DNA polymerase II large subunit
VEDLRDDVDKIIDLGEILIPFGEFIENNSVLPDSSYVYEWWIQDLQRSLSCLPSNYSYCGISKADEVLQKKIKEDFGRDIDLKNPSYTDAFTLSERYSIPLHPKFNLFWHDISRDKLVKLAEYVKEHGEVVLNKELKLVLPLDVKDILIELGALHTQRKGKLVLDKYAYPLVRCCGLDIQNGSVVETYRYMFLKEEEEDVPSLVSKLSGVTIKPRAPFRIGTRMGRPEKASPRKMKPPPHVLFPLGNFGGSQRLFKTAAEKKTIEVEAGIRVCPTCSKTTYRLYCLCGTHTKAVEGKIDTFTIDISEELSRAKKNIKERNLPETIKGVIGTISKNKTPEPLEKGILRAKHGVHVFKDGTIRFDMTDAPLTHFKPKEIGVSVRRLKELGYTKDYQGNDLTHDEQVCELRAQDVIISKRCAEYFIQVSKFIDDLLSKFYKMERFYKIKKLEDLTGHLVVGLAPHTSAGALARIIGFTDAQVCFAHPYYHAAKRRNCLSPSTSILILNSAKPIVTSMQDFYHDIKSEEIIVDDFGTKQKNVEGISTFALNLQNGKTEIKKIKSVIKTKAPRYLLKVKLKSGRSFVSSPSHRVLTWSNGKIEHKKVLELHKDDKFLVYHKLDYYDNDVEEIDLLSEFSQINDKSIVVKGVEELVRRCAKKLGGLKCVSQKLGISKGTFSNYIYRDSIPLSVILKLLELSHETLNVVPRECTLGVKRDCTAIPRMIKVDGKFMRLLGYYLSKGCTTKNGYQIAIACSEEDMRNDVIRCIKDVFNINPYQGKYDVLISNRLIHDFFISILGVGNNAKNKKIPERFIALPKHKMKELLGAYFFAGDGSVEKNHVVCSSVDQNLLRDIGLQLLRFGIFYRLEEEGGVAKRFYEKSGKQPDLYCISIDSSYARKFNERIGFSLERKQSSLYSVVSKESKPSTFGDFILDDVKEVVTIKSDYEFLYDVEVEDLHNFPVNDFILSKNCDGDEDAEMLLMDALLNFSHSYIPDKRGGRMDLPLILTTRLDPAEVDKEAHNIDTLARYPLEFYEATLRHEHSKKMESIMGLVSSRIGSDLQYEQFGFTHDTDDISIGPKESVYKTLKSMMDKMNVQLSLAAKIRAVDEADVACKIIEKHFLPDILGNLKAFSKQSVRCPLCNTIYRRMPLQGLCTKCGGKLTLTVHEMSVKKYLEVSRQIAEKYNLPDYARQRITLVEKSIESLFSSDKVVQKKLIDFF